MSHKLRQSIFKRMCEAEICAGSIHSSDADEYQCILIQGVEFLLCHFSFKIDNFATKSKPFSTSLIQIRLIHIQQ